MRNIIRQPLLHFLLIGLGLFVVYEFTGTKSQSDLRTIVVDRDAMLTFMQYRSKAFNREEFEAQLDGITDEELNKLVDEYVREEAMYREAIALGLNTDDYIIRRRLTQKLMFITQGFITDMTELDSVAVADYYSSHREGYAIDPSITFTHTFFDSDRHGHEKAKRLAQEKLIELNRDKVPFDQAMAHGDRFVYHTNYVERVPDYVASHFGENVARAMFGLEANDSVWHGPMESSYGFHLVMVVAKTSARIPSLNEIYQRVESDARSKQIKEKTDLAIGQLIETYDLDIADIRSEGSSARAAQVRGRSEPAVSDSVRTTNKGTP